LTVATSVVPDGTGDAERRWAEEADGRPGALSRRMSSFIGVVVVLEVIGIIVFGSITIQRYPLWSLVDEGAHFDNVIYVAQHGSYPVLGKTPATEQELAIGQGIYPRHTTINPRTFGLGGLSYEAFQPPLYYYVAAPVTFLSGNYHTKAILLRYFGLLLLIAAIALLARLSRHVLKERWLLGLGGGLLILLMPGVIVRMVTISDINLALPLAILIVTEMWITWVHRSSIRLVLCGLLVGCGVLSDLYLAEMVPAFVVLAVVVLAERRTKRDVEFAVAGGIIAVLVLLPWLAFNVVKYHALTASNVAKQEQLGIVNPTHMRFTIGQLPGLTVQNLFSPLLPQEWGSALVGHAFLAYLAVVFQILIAPAAIVLAIALGRRLISTGLWLLLLPWICNLVLCWYIDIGQQWESGSMVARYTYPTLSVLALFIVAAALSISRSITPVLAAIAVSAVFLVALWIHLVPAIHSSIA
jgi:4-amino-4-deoxy-L-arabinose transferase-like glycosyltransferase